MRHLIPVQAIPLCALPADDEVVGPACSLGEPPRGDVGAGIQDMGMGAILAGGYQKLSGGSGDPAGARRHVLDEFQKNVSLTELHAEFPPRLEDMPFSL
jgi:hypothetical protein